MSSRKPYAVVIGLHPTALGVIRSLTREKVQCIALFDNPALPSAATRLCRRKIRCRVTEPRDLVTALLALARDFTEPAVLFPCGDTDVLAVSQYRDVLADSYRFVLPDHENLARLIDKTQFALAAIEEGLPIPRTSVVRCSGDVEAAVTSAHFPCLIKPWRITAQWEAATNCRKALWVHSVDELRTLYKAVCDTEPRLLVQDWIEGRDDDIYATFVYFNRQSQPLVSFGSRKLRQWPPLLGCTSAAVPHHDPGLERRTVTILQRMGLQGLGSIEWKRDAQTGRYLIVEPTVGRCDLNSPVSLLSRLNVPYLAYCDAAGLPLPSMKAQPRAGCWIQEEYEIFSVLYYRRYGELTLREWWRSLKGNPTCAYWSWRDPMPGIRLALSLIRRALGKALSRFAARGNVPSPENHPLAMWRVRRWAIQDGVGVTHPVKLES
jgi:D-aspartate ligase